MKKGPVLLRGDYVIMFEKFFGGRHMVSRISGGTGLETGQIGDKRGLVRGQ